MNRKFASTPIRAVTIIFAALAAGSIAPGPAGAVHQCGTQHEGLSGDDRGFGQGCNGQG